MQVQIKKTIKAGNSSAVVLPRAWLDKEVRVELVKKSSEVILLDVIKILNKYINVKEVIGIYLTGSYARGEEDENSDIDVLVITNNIDKEMICEGIYNVLIISSKLLEQKLKNDLFPVGQMIKESKALLNSSYLDLINVNVTKKNINWYIKTTKDKLNIIEKVLDKIEKSKGKYIGDRIIYTLVLRIRTLYIIKCLVKNKKYLKKDFLRLIERVSGSSEVYNRYLVVKNNQKEKEVVGVDVGRRLLKYLGEDLGGLIKS